MACICQDDSSQVGAVRDITGDETCIPIPYMSSSRFELGHAFPGE